MYVRYHHKQQTQYCFYMIIMVYFQAVCIFLFCRFLYTGVTQKQQYRSFIQNSFIYNKTMDDSLNK